MTANKTTALAVSALLVGLGAAAKFNDGGFVTVECAGGKVGESAEISFSFHPDMFKSTSNPIFMNIKKAGTSKDILYCVIIDEASKPECRVNNDRFESEGLVDNKLTLVIPNVTHDLQGIYELNVIVNNQDGPPVQCNFTIPTVINKSETLSDGNGVPKVVIVVIPSMLICLSLMSLVFYIRRRRRFRRARVKRREKPKEDRRRFRRARVKRREKPKEDFYFGKLKRVEERQMLLSNGPGSFLIRDSRVDPQVLVLSVNNGEDIFLFQIHRRENEFLMHQGGLQFRTLRDLVDHYKNNEITTADGTYCKLQNVCTKDAGEDQEHLSDNDHAEEQCRV